MYCMNMHYICTLPGRDVHGGGCRSWCCCCPPEREKVDYQPQKGSNTDDDVVDIMHPDFEDEINRVSYMT